MSGLTVMFIAAGVLAASRDENAVPHVIVSIGPAPRYLRVESDVILDGVAGKLSGLYDLETGRYNETIDAGVLSNRTGFDGFRNWWVDASGMPVIVDTRDDNLLDLVWAHIWGRTGPEHIDVKPLPARRGKTRVRLRYSSLTGPLDVTMQAGTRLIESVDDFSGVTTESDLFYDYRRVGNLMVPFGSVSTTGFGAEQERVRSARSLSSVNERVFSPPEPWRGDVLVGVTSVPMERLKQLGQIVLPVRVDDGPVMHFVFDSGSTNYLSPSAARLLQLPVVGDAKSGGIGAGVVAERYTMVKRLRIGEAEMANIPFAVLDDGFGFDGTLGCEILQRVTVRFDFEQNLVLLAGNPSAFHDKGTALPLRTGRCQPEIDAILDGLSGAALVDSGSSTAVDVTAPFVRRNHLIERYNATEPTSGDGIGGSSHGRLGRAGAFQLGPFTLRDIDVDLSVMRRGSFSDPAEMANVGLPVLERFTVTLDYRSHRLWLARKRSLNGIRHEDF